MKRNWIGLVAGLSSCIFGLATLASARALAPPPGSPGAGTGVVRGQVGSTPDILLIVVDDIGWRDLNASIPTPNLAALAGDGLSFQRAYAMPYCSPSRFALLFGLQPYREGLGTYIDPNLAGEVTVAPSRVSLASLLGDNGYATLAAGKWHLSTYALGTPAAFDWPRRFGFDAFRAGRIGNIGQSVTYTYWPRIDDGVQTQSTEYNTTAVRRAAVDWWQAQDGPRFAYVAFHAAHAPFHVPPANLLPAQHVVGTSNRSRYEAMIMALDTEIGRLLASVDRANTLVILVGDNGTPPDAAAPGQDGRKLKGTVHEGGIHVPLIVAGPGVARGASTHSLVGVIDVFATVAELLHLSIPSGLARDSISFAPILTNPGQKTRTSVYAQEFAPNGAGPQTRNTKAIVSQRYKLIDDGIEQRLFDVMRDPEELYPVTNRPWVYGILRHLLNRERAQGAP